MRSITVAVWLCGSLLTPLCLAQQPDEATMLYDKGVQYLNADKPFDALEAFTEAIARTPGFAEAHCGQGDAYSRTSRYPLAIQAYTRALKLEPRHVGALSGRGFAHYYSEQYEPARTDLVAAIKADVTRADTVVGFLFGELEAFRSNLKEKK